jgi:hypothetical protein
MGWSGGKMSDPRENSVKHLCDLYNVVIGVALAIAIEKVIDEEAAYIPISRQHIWIFLTFVVTAIPFYHGAIRHLYATYVEEGGSKRVKRGALLLDFAILFTESGLFVALAYLIQSPAAFVALFILLIFLDSIWGFIAVTSIAGTQAQSAEKTWALINVVYFIVLLIGYFSFDVGSQGFSWEPRHTYMLLATAFLRTVIDYFFSWDFYYP